MEIKKDIPTSVMIVEDEKDLCFLLERIIRKENLFTSSVNTLTEAKYKLNKINPAILFLDSHLPDGTGSDFIGHVKKLFPSIKIIMITAHDAPHDVEKAFTKGADYFISKPFNSATIRNMLNHISMRLTA